MKSTELGIDLDKSIFRLHVFDWEGAVFLQEKVPRGALLTTLGRLKSCLTGMVACPTSHFWAREIAALRYDVRLIPRAFVKPYVK